jgi:hypothetical protein
VAAVIVLDRRGEAGIAGELVGSLLRHAEDVGDPDKADGLGAAPGHRLGSAGSSTFSTNSAMSSYRQDEGSAMLVELMLGLAMWIGLIGGRP